MIFVKGIRIIKMCARDALRQNKDARVLVRSTSHAKLQLFANSQCLRENSGTFRIPSSAQWWKENIGRVTNLKSYEEFVHRRISFAGTLIYFFKVTFNRDGTVSNLRKLPTNLTKLTSMLNYTQRTERTIRARHTHGLRSDLNTVSAAKLRKWRIWNIPSFIHFNWVEKPTTVLKFTWSYTPPSASPVLCSTYHLQQP